MTWILIGIGIALALILSGGITDAARKLLPSKVSNTRTQSPSVISPSPKRDYGWVRTVIQLVAVGMILAATWMLLHDFLPPEWWDVAKKQGESQYFWPAALLTAGVLTLYVVRPKKPATNAATKTAGKSGGGGSLLALLGTLAIIGVIGFLVWGNWLSPIIEGEGACSGTAPWVNGKMVRGCVAGSKLPGFINMKAGDRVVLTAQVHPSEQTYSFLGKQMERIVALILPRFNAGIPAEVKKVASIATRSDVPLSYCVTTGYPHPENTRDWIVRREGRNGGNDQVVFPIPGMWYDATNIGQHASQFLYRGNVPGTVYIFATKLENAQRAHSSGCLP